MTLNNQMLVRRCCITATYAFRAAMLTSVIVALVYALANYTPVFAAIASLLFTVSVCIGGIVFPGHALGVMQFKASPGAILLDRLGATRELLTAKLAFSNVNNTVNSPEQIKPLCLSSALV